MTQHKPRQIKTDGDMTPEERELETVRRYQEAIDAAKSGVIKRKVILAPSPPLGNSDLDETIPGP